MLRLAFFTVVFTWAGIANAARTPSSSCYDLIKSFEGLKLTAYQDVAGIWTIGYGSTYYEDGSKVKKGDVITLAKATTLFERDVKKFALGVDSAVGSAVTLKKQQFDALVSFSYNVGLGNLQSSTLLKLVKANPNNAAIRAEFMKWVYAGGKVVEGLKNRRTKEANLYFS